DFLWARDLKALPTLQRGDKLASVEQRIECSGIEPCKAAPQFLHAEAALLEVKSIEIGNLELIALGRLQAPGKVNHIGIVEVESGHRPVGIGLLGLFLDAGRPVITVELDYSVALGVRDLVGEHCGSVGPLPGPLK